VTHRPHLLLCACVALTCVALASCRPIHVASDYDQQCVDDDDCVAVFVGDTCKITCEAAGIRADEKDRYDQANAAPCPPPFGEYLAIMCLSTVPEPPICDAVEAFCSDGTCAARTIPIEEQ
jgi:hypothetical protein